MTTGAVRPPSSSDHIGCLSSWQHLPSRLYVSHRDGHHLTGLGSCICCALRLLLLLLLFLLLRLLLLLLLLLGFLGTCMTTTIPLCLRHSLSWNCKEEGTPERQEERGIRMRMLRWRWSMVLDVGGCRGTHLRSSASW